MTTTSPRLTLAQAVLPRSGWLAQVLLAVGGSIAIALSAQVSIELLPFSPVPITLQTLMVLLVGVAFGGRLGALTVVLYIGWGLAGLPVFASGQNAWSPLRGGLYILGPTLGYLIGFVVAAFAVGWLAERGWDRSLWRAAVAMALGNLIIYTFGLLWLSRFVPFPGTFAAGLLPFLVGDALKIAVATALLPLAWRIVTMAGLGRHHGAP